VNRNGLRLLRLVNTLLDFSRIEAGRVRAVYQPTDLAAYTADLASVFRAAIERAGLRLAVDCLPLGEPAFVDRGIVLVQREMECEQWRGWGGAHGGIVGDYGFLFSFPVSLVGSKGNGMASRWQRSMAAS
jgi:hypothetical protein